MADRYLDEHDYTAIHDATSASVKTVINHRGTDYTVRFRKINTGYMMQVRMYGARCIDCRRGVKGYTRSLTTGSAKTRIPNSVVLPIFLAAVKVFDVRVFG